jgi:hypothetical protein
MKIVFAGPSLSGEVRDGRMACAPSVLIRPPAAQGAILRAVDAGANVIGLVDGVYEHLASPWHKEILFAMQSGVVVFGGASLGALRAAECAPFGMIGVGRIYDDYASGRRIDDSDVAQIHAPPEMDSAPLSAALVNIHATIDRAHAKGEISALERAVLRTLAESIFFKELTIESVAAAALASGRISTDILARLARNWVDQKRIDAREVVMRVEAAPDARSPSRPSWSLNESGLWLRLVSGEMGEAWTAQA